MLPAYLSYFLGIEGTPTVDEPAQASARAGPLLVERRGVGRLPRSCSPCIGVVIRAGGDVLIDVMPSTLSIAIGLAARRPRHRHAARATTCRSRRRSSTRADGPHGRGRCSSSASPTPSRRSAARSPFFLDACSAASPATGTLSGVLHDRRLRARAWLVLTALTVTLALARGGLLRGAALGACGSRQRGRRPAHPRRRCTSSTTGWFDLRLGHRGQAGRGGGLSTWVEGRPTDAQAGSTTGAPVRWPSCWVVAVAVIAVVRPSLGPPPAGRRCSSR